MDFGNERRGRREKAESDRWRKKESDSSVSSPFFMFYFSDKEEKKMGEKRRRIPGNENGEESSDR